ncbi:hypothetical protein [Aestuariivirga sp.]|uniref:hypothetical protein n=1 Tax=Aestuariivirga sp. TaxID=2650926 RepID=UPI0039E2D2E6
MRFTSIAVAASLVLAGLVMAPAVEASGSCPGQPHGKCPVKKKVSKSRSDFTPAQREKILADARKICVKKYGATSNVYRVEYDKWRVICTTPGY